MAPERIAVAADHVGVGLKSLVEETLKEMGYPVLNLGTDGPESVDYPDFAGKLAAALKDGSAGRGVLICGTGIGMSSASCDALLPIASKRKLTVQPPSSALRSMKLRPLQPGR